MASNKFNARKAKVDDLTFDSKIEAKRYTFLKDKERAGEIENLRMQIKYELIPAQWQDDQSKRSKRKCIERACTYIADFVYEKNGQTVVEDVKGYRKGGAYATFSIKRKLMLYRHQIQIKEIRRWNQ